MFLCGQSASAQSDSLELEHPFFGKYLNPGITIGFGNVHPNKVVPMFHLKLGQVNSNFIYFDGERTSFLGADISFDFDYIKTKSGRVQALGMGMGTSNWRRFPDVSVTEYLHTITAHYSNYKPGSKSRWTIQGGIAVQEVHDEFLNRINSSGIMPWGGFSYTLHAFKLPDVNTTRVDFTEEADGEFKTLDFMSRNFNPAVGIGFGSGYTGVGGTAILLNAGPLYLKLGYTIPFSQVQLQRSRSIQYGINLFHIPIFKEYATLFTLSGDYTIEQYREGLADEQQWLPDGFRRRSLMIGINGYKVEGRGSWTFKVGLGSRSGNSEVKNFDEDFKQYPVAELGVHLHIFKLSHQAFMKFL